jgi:hypothetical protein
VTVASGGIVVARAKDTGPGVGVEIDSALGRAVAALDTITVKGRVSRHLLPGERATIMEAKVLLVRVAAARAAVVTHGTSK